MTDEIAKAVLRRDDMSLPQGDDPGRADARPLFPMFSPPQVVGATFLGGPLGGFWVMASNYRRLRRPGAARWAVVAGVAVTALLVGVGLLLPERLPRPTLQIPSLVIMWAIAQHYQEAMFAEHVRAGGPVASNWHVVGRALVSLLVTGALIFGVAIGVGMASRPDSVRYGESEVFYDEGASRADAERVGAALEKMGYFQQPFDVIVERKRESIVVRFVVGDEKYLGDQEAKETFAEVGQLLAAELGGQVFVELTDPTVERRVPVGWYEKK